MKGKELGHFLMNDGRVNKLRMDILGNGCQVEVSIHSWPDGHRSECRIYLGPDDKAKEDLLAFISHSFEVGNYVGRLV